MVHVLTTSYNMSEIGDINMVFRWSIETNKSIPLEFSQKNVVKIATLREVTTHKISQMGGLT